MLRCCSRVGAHVVQQVIGRRVSLNAAAGAFQQMRHVQAAHVLTLWHALPEAAEGGQGSSNELGSTLQQRCSQRSKDKLRISEPC